MGSTTEPDSSLEKKIEDLTKENQKLRKKIKRLKKTMDITSRHSDVVAGELEGKVEASIKEIEARVRLISETIPVPVLIARISDGKVMYVNEHSCRVFGFPPEIFIKKKASELYQDPADRQVFLKTLAEQGQLSNFEVRLKKNDGELLWGDLFSQPLDFKDEPCILTVIYDLTDRRKAEDEIRRLRKELDQKEVKYLIFILDGSEYGIELMKVREIVSMMPMTPLANAPAYVKGVINLRGSLIPVTDLRIRLGLNAEAYTEKTCIIVADIWEKENRTVAGGIVDAVTDVRRIKVREVDPLPALLSKNGSGLISGIAKFENEIKILLNSVA